MRMVAMGSSAEQGSSIRMTSGFTAMARAMHSRCCWPPDRAKALCLSLSLTSSHSAARRRRLLDHVVQLGPRHAVDLRGPKATLS